MAWEHAQSKNFTYGDLWAPEGLKMGLRGGRTLVDPAKITRNAAFLDFLEKHHYRVYLDKGMMGVAQTQPNDKKIVLNGNYSEELTEVMLQHEMGHLMLFDVNQFVTVGPQTLRSVITKVIYTPDNLIKYGIEQLLLAENVVQDVIIETTSNGHCVCHAFLTETGENAGVKHLDRLESASHIAEEVCKNVLQERPNSEQSELEGDLNKLIDAMRKGLASDSEEISEKIENTKASKSHRREMEIRRVGRASVLQKQLKRVDEMEARGKYSEKLQQIKENAQQELEQVLSPEREEQDKAKAQQLKERAVATLEKKLANNRELDRLLGEATKKSTGEPLGSNSGDSQGSQSGKGSEASGTSSSGKPQHSEVSPELHANHTDHLSDDFESTGGHSFDCGLPYPVLVERDESAANENHLLTFDSKARVKKIQLQEEDLDNALSNKTKIPEHELTYFKSNKREFSESDMLQGKRKLRVSGVNVLVGLDISGSMTAEWGKMFGELSALIEELQETLDIQNIVYFTYNQKLQEWSREIGDLTVKAGGGNAFGHVYQDLLTRLPLGQRNEIVLVTDCGDNLGFKLSDSCEAERNGQPVENHVSIIDTENAGFYDKNEFDEADWSLYRYNDSTLFQSIQDNITELIER
jgi:hypothetical protein